MDVFLLFLACGCFNLNYKERGGVEKILFPFFFRSQFYQKVSR